MNRILAYFVPATHGPSCSVVLFWSGFLLVLSVALAVAEVNPG